MRQNDILSTIVLWMLGMFLVAGCSNNSQSTRANAKRVLRLATTTSTRDTGLLEKLVPVFERQHDCRVDVIAVGTGAALKLGERGDVDVVMVHARKAEEAFLRAGHGTRHEEFMYNDFVLVGPASDPAKIRDRDPVEAMRQIARGKHRFVSRGDDSGTHKRELILWREAGGRPAWNDYLESGQGMGPSLIIADEKQGYILVDRGTYLRFQEKIDLMPLSNSSQLMRNPYAAIVVNSKKHPGINQTLAGAFVDYLISRNTQHEIGEYQVAGHPLFQPTRLDDEN